MTTIKSYTDLEQSKKLAEILPLESADTIWNLTNPDLPNIRAIPYESSDYNNKYLNIIPAWSLAALLDVLPQILCLKPILDLEECSIQYSGTDLYVVANNPVDACYEMIIELHKIFVI
jgi:hypothetical protein